MPANTGRAGASHRVAFFAGTPAPTWPEPGSRLALYLWAGEWLIDRLSDSTRRVAVVRGVESRLRVDPVGFAAFRAQLP